VYDDRAVAAEPVKVGQMTRLSNLLDRMAELVDVTENRLRPVMLPRPPETPQDIRAVPMCSDFGDACDRLDSYMRQWAALIERVDL
jgi:hypothetical protein